MKKEDLITLRNEAEVAVTQVYSNVEDLKNQLTNANNELERYRGEYRAYNKQIELVEAREAEQAKKEEKK
jgi:predicted  nucleic acid-binding Zn-ribbon protein